MIEQVRELLARTSNVPFNVASLSADANLYDAGLTSFASVQLMLAIEQEFDIEFPETMLTRRTFASITNIAEAVSSLVRKAA